MLAYYVPGMGLSLLFYLAMTNVNRRQLKYLVAGPVILIGCWVACREGNVPKVNLVHVDVKILRSGGSKVTVVEKKEWTCGQRTGSNSWFHWLMTLLSLASHIHFRGFPGGSAVEDPLVNAGEAVSILGSRRSPGGGNGNPLRCSCLGNPMDSGAWQTTVHGITKNQTWLSD